MDWLAKKHVCELDLADNDLVQVLLSKFSLHLVGTAARLELEFNGRTPTIRRRESKNVVRDSMPEFELKARKYQKSLDALLLDRSREEVILDDPAFVFRYGSGGTLPIIELAGESYYCLFYRDIHPIGWNIANGGTDSFEELMNPFDAIFRELSEELIILDLENRIDYQFSSDDDLALTRPEFLIARQMWQTHFARRHIESFDKQILPMKWKRGPDSLIIRFENERPRNLQGCFLNVNALDFGIEVDRIAEITIEKNSILLDGEMVGKKLLDRPIGLFKVDRLTENSMEENSEFLPDIVYHSGNRQHRAEIERTVECFVQHLTRDEVRDRRQEREWKETDRKYRLCPVTSRLIRRCVAERAHRIFISYASQDEVFARKLRSDLEGKGVSCWFAPENLRVAADYKKEIDEEIARRDRVVVILSESSIESPWVGREVATTLGVENRLRRKLLLPIRIDDSVLHREAGWSADIRRRLSIGDFSKWSNDTEYRKALSKLTDEILSEPVGSRRDQQG